MSSQRFVKCLSFRTNAHLNCWSGLSFSDDPSSGDTLDGPHNGLMITHEKMENLGAQGTVSSIPMVTAVSTDSVAPEKRQRYATTIGMLSDNVLLDIFDFYRKSGDQSDDPFLHLEMALAGPCMYAEGGDKSYLSHHAQSARTARSGLLGRFWVSGPPFSHGSAIAYISHGPADTRILESVMDSQHWPTSEMLP
jgi:hypothetical protein